ncbi:hypothetical protein EOS_35665 [Caballeronia mineralivorans PML1(12)]|uniref:Transmembrane protein n=1 Tax=Caballeronia mineralivorans PML1(12) TaxID=908627 RepID=A0A0J1FP31_9BURK|nr:hypothetical protein [Caballeronia mineralivorans]KLU21508.1 hypothetical protein EOS_35665 [Caballeronia mineralivorans PML1(12)]
MLAISSLRSGTKNAEAKSFSTPLTKEESDVHGGSAGFIDLDEGVHGANAAVKALYSAIHDGPADMWDTLAREGKELSASPVAWSRTQVTPSGAADVAVSMGVSTLVLPLAALAIKAGFDEIVESNSLRRVLKQKRTAIQQTLEDLKIIYETNISEAGTPASALALITARRCAEKQRLTSVKAAIRHNRYDLGIGASSLISGGVIFLKALEDIALQSTLVGMAKGVNLAAVVIGSTALQGVTAVAGITGTVVLGPAAAISAVCLGAFFYGQARAVRKDIQADRGRLIRDEVSGNDVSKAHLDFVTHKLVRREKFAKKFERWNLGFLTGSSIYAISVTVKATLFVTAAVGLGILASNPYVLPIVLGILIVGSVVMVASSTQFLVAHGRSKRHQSYTRQEVPLVSRELDALQHAMRERSSVATESGSAAGGDELTLGSAYYRFAGQQDVTRQTLLEEIARGTGKFYAWEARATDDVMYKGRVINSKQRIKDWFARLSAAAAYIQAWFKREDAGASARDRYGRSANCLTSAAVEAWLSIDAPEIHEMQRLRLTEILQAEHQFLKIKKRICDELVGSDFGDSEAEGLDAQPNKVFENLRSEIQTDKERRVFLKKLLLDAQPTEGEDFAPQKLLDLKQRFLQLRMDNQATQPADDDFVGLNRQLAEYLTVGMSLELTATRGVLFDMHRQALRLREGIRSSPLDLRIVQKEGGQE